MNIILNGIKLEHFLEPLFSNVLDSFDDLNKAHLNENELGQTKGKADSSMP